MPHDRSGNVLEVGDKISIGATVKSITTGEEYCNVTVETDEAMFPGTYKTAITLNAKQVDKIPVVEFTQGNTVSQ